MMEHKCSIKTYILGLMQLKMSMYYSVVLQQQASNKITALQLLEYSTKNDDASLVL